MKQCLRIRAATAAAATLFLALTTGLVQAQVSTQPAIPSFGAIHTAPNAAERPSKSLRYKVLFSVT